MKVNKRTRRVMYVLLAALLIIVLPVVLWAMVTQPLIFASEKRQSVADVSPARLQNHVKALATEFAPRDAAHPQNLDRVADYISKELEAAGGEVSHQPFQVGGHTYQNVLAYFGPASGERLVIGAHYDAAGELPGADDNASGVAGLLELAHLLKEIPLKRRVELVAYTLEEPPYFGTEYMGSAVHAASLKEQGVEVRLMLSLEMIGYFSDEPESQRFPLPQLRYIYPTKGNFIAVVGLLGKGGPVRRVKSAMRAATDLPVYSINAPASLPGIDLSDHRNYWKAGYPAAMITDTSFFRNRNYHTAGDMPATLDYQRMAQVVEGVFGVILAEAG